MEVALIRNGSYLKLASAMGVSSVGDGIRLVAAPLLASTVTPEPLLISLVVVANRLLGCCSAWQAGSSRIGSSGSR